MILENIIHQLDDENGQKDLIWSVYNLITDSI